MYQNYQVALNNALSQNQLFNEDFSFDSTLKNNYSEFSFVSPPPTLHKNEHDNDEDNKKNKCDDKNEMNIKKKKKPNASSLLSLDTFEKVINNLNNNDSGEGGTSGKVSAGKRLFEKQQQSARDTVDFDKEFTALIMEKQQVSQCFSKRNSMKRSSKRPAKLTTATTIAVNLNKNKSKFFFII